MCDRPKALVVIDNGESYSDWRVEGALLVDEGQVGYVEALFYQFLDELKASIPLGAPYPEIKEPNYHSSQEEMNEWTKAKALAWEEWRIKDRPRFEREEEIKKNFGKLLVEFLGRYNIEAVFYPLDHYVSKVL
jgi:hypothetical protein